MLVFNHAISEVYDGTLKVATAAVKPGMMVTPDYSAGTCAALADDTAGDAAGILIVANYDSYADTDVTDTKNFEVAVGEYARLKSLQVGEIFTTDQFKGTYSGLTVGSVFAPGDAGTFEAVAARTPAIKLVIVEKTTLLGENALKFKVTAV